MMLFDDLRWRTLPILQITEQMRKRKKGEAEHREDFETCLRLAEKAEEEKERKERG